MTEPTSKPSGHSQNRSEDFEINLKDVFDLIKHSYKLIAIITTIFLIFGIHYAETRPPVYSSSAMIEVGRSALNGLSSGGSGGASNALSGLMSMQSSSADVETVLLQSPYILGEVVKKLKLDISVSPHYSGFFDRLFARFGAPRGSVSVSLLTVPNELLAKPLILVAQNKTQYTLYTSAGKKILEGVVGQVAIANNFSKPLEIEVTALNTKPGIKFDVLKQTIAAVSDGIAGALDIKEQGQGTGILKMSYRSGDRVQAQKLLNAILSVAVRKNLEDKSHEAAKTLQFISMQLPISKSHLKSAEIKWNQFGVKSGVFDPAREGPAIETIISGLNQELETLKFKKLVLLQKFTRQHPFVIAITQKENEIRKEIKSYKTKLDKMPSLSEKAMNFERNEKMQEGIYSALMESAQNMEMVKASTVSNVRVLSAASYPVSRIPVATQKIVLGSILLGIMVSLVIIFIRHALSPTIEDPDVVERKLGISVMAIIPHSQKQGRHNKKIKYDKLYANTASFLLAQKDPNDISIEGVRSLRTAIQMHLLEAKNNVIAITGCSPGVGKSFISSNLAALFSDLSKRVLVIDADIRLGKMCQSFGKPKTPGLSTFLQKQASIDSIVQTVIPNQLDFIATGVYPEKPAELFHQDIFGELIEKLRHQYDLVVIDTPPILAVTDSALILRYAATNLMVLGVGKDQMKEVIYAKNILEKAGVTLTALVFNTLKQQKAGFGHNYGYGSYHYTYGK